MDIVVVEDDAEHGDELRDFFEEQGHRVTVATNAPHALSLVGALQPDVVLIDIALPVFDGNFLAAEIRRCHASPPRLIAMTGRPGSVQPVLFDSFVLKPVAPADLLRTLIESVVGEPVQGASQGARVDDDAEDTLA